MALGKFEKHLEIPIMQKLDNSYQNVNNQNLYFY